MRDPGQVRVTGPLAEYAEGFRAELAAQGYVRDAAARQLQLMAGLSGWLADTGVAVEDLVSAARAEEFLRARRAGGYRILLSRRALTPLIGYLRRQGVVPVQPERACTPVEMLVEDYRRYLVGERGLADATVGCYLGAARLFLSECEQPDGLELEQLTAAQVTAFVVGQCRRRRVAAAKVLVTGLRSLLRFLFVSGYMPRQLVSAVPTPAGWGGGSLPRALGEEAVTGLLAGCDRATPGGRRDLAILTLLARLGLRAGEVAALELDDVDWHRGEIAVRGKGGRKERMPLPVDVGEALAAYLHPGRPRAGCRALFLRMRAPVGGLTATGVADVVRSACIRAGVPAAGPHRLRHHAATAMLRGGATLADVGQALRQVRVATTAVYAKVDRVALRALAQPWPGGAA